jgi:hypothetical protein
MAIVRAMDGHAMEVVPTESGRRWRLLCSCGFGRPRWAGDRPATCATEREAIRKGVWHLQKLEQAERKRERVDGISTRAS